MGVTASARSAAETRPKKAADVLRDAGGTGLRPGLSWGFGVRANQSAEGQFFSFNCALREGNWFTITDQRQTRSNNP